MLLENALQIQTAHHITLNDNESDSRGHLEVFLTQDRDANLW